MTEFSVPQPDVCVVPRQVGFTECVHVHIRPVEVVSRSGILRPIKLPGVAIAVGELFRPDA
jgi:hypothetical protein